METSLLLRALVGKTIASVAQETCLKMGETYGVRITFTDGSSFRAVAFGDEVVSWLEFDSEGLL